MAKGRDRESLMKEIRLHKLTLRDFKGFTFTLEAEGEDVDIWGANATGKTTIADAFAWLLFGKDSLGRSDFEIKNLDAQGEAAHGLEHSVEGVLDINGQAVVLRKVYREVWTKKRGSATATFTGNTVDYYIDGVPTKEKEYAGQIAEIAGDEQIFRLLTSPAAFPSLHWQKQRALLLDVCGDISDADVIASDRKLAPLGDILGKRSLDDHRKVITARRTELNKELEKIPVRIDEVRRSLPDVTGLDQKELQSDIVALEKAVGDAKLTLQGIDTGGRIGELTRTLAGIGADIHRLEDAHLSETMKAVNSLNIQITDLEGKIRRDENAALSRSEDIERKKRLVADLEAELVILRQKWGVIDAEAFDPEKVSYI